MTPPRLVLFTDTALLEAVDFVPRAEALMRTFAAFAAPAGSPSTSLLLRGAVDGRRLYDLALALSHPSRHFGVDLAVADRLDVARAAVLPVHLATHGLPVHEARRQLGPRVRITSSVHDDAEAERAVGADAWIVGNVWETASHPGRPARGTDHLRALAARPDAPPVIAIGGVTPERVAEAVAAGAHGVAVLGGVWRAEAPERALTRYLEAFDDVPAAPPARPDR